MATCVNMHVRMYAANHHIALETVTTTVSLDRGDPAAAVFTYSLELAGNLSAEEQQNSCASRRRARFARPCREY